MLKNLKRYRKKKNLIWKINATILKLENYIGTLK